MAPALKRTALSGEVYTPSPVSSHSRAPSLSGAMQGIVPILPTLTEWTLHPAVLISLLSFLLSGTLQRFWPFHFPDLRWERKISSYAVMSSESLSRTPVMLTGNTAARHQCCSQRASGPVSGRDADSLLAQAAHSAPFPHGLLPVAPCLPPPPWSSMVLLPTVKKTSSFLFGPSVSSSQNIQIIWMFWSFQVWACVAIPWTQVRDSQWQLEPYTWSSFLPAHIRAIPLAFCHH